LTGWLGTGAAVWLAATAATAKGYAGTLGAGARAAATLAGGLGAGTAGFVGGFAATTNAT
jgi:hypothetical protein